MEVNLSITLDIKNTKINLIFYFLLENFNKFSLHNYT